MEAQRKTKIGRVVSDKMQKTVVVAVESMRRHRLYHKPVKRTNRFKVHDAENACHVGDLVRIVEARPFSKEKSWRVEAILEKSTGIGEIQA